MNPESPDESVSPPTIETLTDAQRHIRDLAEKIASATTLVELFVAVRNGVPGQTEFYSGELLRQRIQAVLTDGQSLDLITRTAGLRRKVHQFLLAGLERTEIKEKK